MWRKTIRIAPSGKLCVCLGNKVDNVRRIKENVVGNEGCREGIQILLNDNTLNH